MRDRIGRAGGDVPSHSPIRWGEGGVGGADPGGDVDDTGGGEGDGIGGARDPGRLLGLLRLRGEFPAIGALYGSSPPFPRCLLSKVGGRLRIIPGD